MVGDCWYGAWRPLLEGILLDPSVAEFMKIQMSLLHLRHVCETQDSWIGAALMALGVYKQTRHSQKEEQLETICAYCLIWK